MHSSSKTCTNNPKTNLSSKTVEFEEKLPTIENFVSKTTLNQNTLKTFLFN